ncbi:MAG: hypothetical protein HZB30_06730 [Nitrospirae bacterium]|nr:hypothetical protein [Nitrospirota bacterium]
MSQCKKIQIRIIILFLFSFSVFLVNPAFGWDDETHLAIAKASEYSKWYYVVGPDIAKVKAGNIETYNHFFDNNNNVEVVPEIIFEQAGRYNHPEDEEGHLYGAILASLREYASRLKETGSEYHLAFCAHYIGDLSQPLHNIPYDDFNKEHHAENDGAAGKDVLQQISKIKKHMYRVNLRSDHFEEDLAKEIALIANKARLLGYELIKGNRNLSKEEAYIQLGQSASLFKAVLKHFSKVR